MIKFFLATEYPTFSTTTEGYKVIEKQGNEFQKLLWGENGLEERLSSVNTHNFEGNIDLVLFEFYLNPIDNLAIKIDKKPIDYRQNEKALGIRISITNDNFFNLKEDKIKLLLGLMIEKVNLLNDFIKSKKIEFNVVSFRNFLVEIK
ncbi:hypothetical protein MTP09_09920 [Chryseobacterium suipulveris]|uniref:Uncharacterized protein n=1 Tax=Chryseobacterium suipulveris TaxID=2929800 RepID=A0ABY4BN78_9FLAO|nr:hypothetical protein [Chryseobacterium suipulveris]UOE40229.1 hypothetical protein MTP09_09920 [Chryseobacterium suipulveris]